MKHWISHNSHGMISLKIKYGILLSLMVILTSCIEQEKHPLEAIHENDSLSDDYKLTSDFLIENNTELAIVVRLQFMDLGEGIDSSDIDNRKRLGEIEMLSHLIIEEIDRQYDFLVEDQLPFESNFDDLNRKMKEFNQFISDEFSIDKKNLTQVELQLFDYEDFLLSPKKYLIQKRIMVSNSVYYLLVELLQEGLGIQIRTVENET